MSTRCCKDCGHAMGESQVLLLTDTSVVCTRHYREYLAAGRVAAVLTRETT